MTNTTITKATIRQQSFAAIAAFFATGALLGASVSPVRAQSAQPVSLVQPGDNQLSCEALAGQINALATAEAQPAPKKKKKKGFGLGSLTQVLSMASPMLGGMGGGMGGAMASQALGTAQSMAMQSQANEQMENAMSMAMPQAASIGAQRKDRLMGLFETKGC